MKAAVIVRCSGSTFRSSTWARAATGMHDGDVEAAHVADVGRALRVRPRAGAASRSATSFGSPMHAAIEPRRQARADADLAGVRDRLHRQGLGRVRAGDQQLAVDAPRQEELECAGSISRPTSGARSWRSPS